MGKASSSTTASAAAVTEMKRKKKKGRPSLTDLQNRKKIVTDNNNNKNNVKKTLTPSVNYDVTHSRRSGGRNANHSNSPPFDDDDDDDERKEKKVKLVVRLPQSNSNQVHQNSQHSDSGSGSGSVDSDADTDLGGDDHVSPSPKKRKINAVDRRSDTSVPDQVIKVPKVTQHGLQLEPGPTTPLPEKKLLVFILDRLQKKDTYGVFSEPVDPDELPDYFEIIEQPMDFGTVRKKLSDGLYSKLEELEADVLLICSNAMQYNAPDTVYFRQARTIQDIAKRDFANLRHEGDDGEPQPKVVRRGRPPNSKNVKKTLDESSPHRNTPELSSGAILANIDDKALGSNSNYSLRRGPTLQRHRSSDAFVTPYRSRNTENGSELSMDWNSEFPASILRADMKYGKKGFVLDENKRDTYNDYVPPSNENEMYSIDGDMKRLMGVGIQYETHGYAKSLARFAADLGPVAWKIASKKIESALPPGVKFGPGWVGENEPIEKVSHSVLPDILASRPITPPTTSSSTGQYKPSDELVEAVRKLNSQNESASSTSPLGNSFQKSTNINGLSSLFGYNPLLSQKSGIEEGIIPYQMLGGMVPQNMNQEATSSSSQGWGRVNNSVKAPLHEMSVDYNRKSLQIQPDLNLRVRGTGQSQSQSQGQGSGSPSSSSLQIGSPQQPDLALQL